MGIAKAQATERREGPRPKQSKLDWGLVAPQNTSGGVDWDEATPSKVLRVVYLATKRGMAVSLSATANGRAVSVTILDGGSRPKWYANSPDELEAVLDALLLTFGE